MSLPRVARPDILHLERLACRAWPAVRELDLDGWLVRASAGFTDRANSVHPFAAGQTPVADRVAACEAIYAAAGLTTIFKVTDASRPAGLEAAPADRGYARDGGALVMTAGLDGTSAHGADGGITLRRQADDGWMDAFLAFAGADARHRPTLGRIVGGCRAPFVLAEAAVGGDRAALGRAVAEDGWVGLFEVVTRLASRRRGLARRVTAALLAWGRSAGASRAYLQVVPSNEPAIALYRQFGFEPAYEYRYWKQPPP